jgi:hypothetical protein
VDVNIILVRLSKEFLFRRASSVSDSSSDTDPDGHVFSYVYGVLNFLQHCHCRVPVVKLKLTRFNFRDQIGVGINEC